MHVARCVTCKCGNHKLAFRLSWLSVVETALYNGQSLPIGLVALFERLEHDIGPQDLRLHACLLIIVHRVCEDRVNNLARLFWN